MRMQSATTGVSQGIVALVLSASPTMARITASIIAPVIGLLPGTTYAQSSDDALILGEIVVVAQEREENAQDVPMSIKPLSAHRLRDAGVTSIERLGAAVPGRHRGIVAGHDVARAKAAHARADRTRDVHDGESWTASARLHSPNRGHASSNGTRRQSPSGTVRGHAPPSIAAESSRNPGAIRGHASSARNPGHASSTRRPRRLSR